MCGFDERGQLRFSRGSGSVLQTGLRWTLLGNLLGARQTLKVEESFASLKTQEVWCPPVFDGRYFFCKTTFSRRRKQLVRREWPHIEKGLASCVQCRRSPGFFGSVFSLFVCPRILDQVIPSRKIHGFVLVNRNLRRMGQMPARRAAARNQEANQNQAPAQQNPATWSRNPRTLCVLWKIRGFVENEPSPNVFTSFAPSFDRWSEAGACRPHYYEFAQRMPSLEFSRGETN
jgi:hypothetical protein